MSVPIRSRVVLMAAFLLIAAGVHPAAAGSADSSNFTIDLRTAVTLEVLVDPAAKTVGVPFEVTVNARGDGGAIVPATETISLSAPPARPSRELVWLQEGTATFSLSLDTPAASVALSAEGANLSGSSVAFEVQAVPGGCGPVWLQAGIVDLAGAPVADETIRLANGQTCTTDGYGQCQFAAVSTGVHEIWAEVNGVESDHRSIVVNCNPMNRITFQVVGEGCNPWGLTPVLLVPGIMGSTTSCVAIFPYPKLTKRPPGKFDFWCRFSAISFHGLLDPYHKAGWRDLVAALQSVHPGYQVGCTVFPTPYDWRMDAAEAASKYLKPMIDEAKEKGGTSTVDIVAHSMGGIVSRAYIASGSFPQPSDIGQLIMVGTPNHGSPMAYFMWEGGDPILADAVKETMADDGFYGLLDFYRVTSRNLYGLHYGFIDDAIGLITRPPGVILSELGDGAADAEYILFKNAYRRKIKRLAHEHVESLRQLLPTSDVDFLRSPDETEYGLTVGGNVNYRLDGLNLDTSKLTTPVDPDPNRVRTFVLASQDEPSLGSLRVFGGGPSWAAEFYQDGRPLVDESPLNDSLSTPLDIDPSHFETTAGDGTVALSSAQLAGVGNDAQDKGEHSGLVGAYSAEIVTLLTGMTPKLMAPLAALGTVTPALTVEVTGRVQPLVVDPSAARAGVEPGTAALVADVVGSEVSLETGNAVVLIQDPGTGAYSVQLDGAYAEDFVVTIEYRSGEGSWSERHIGYHGSAPFEFAFSVDPTAQTPLLVDLAPAAPVDLIADFASGLTTLSWQFATDPSVVGYTVYSKAEGEASMQPVGSTPGATFATGDAWAASDVTPTRLYAVAAFDAAGKESFLSRPVRNNDRDHDGRTDQEEMDRGTDPSNPDTDSDGLTDGEEAYYGTDPFDDDSDGDGFSDDVEVRGGTDPLDAASTPLIFSDGFEVGSWAEWSSAVQ